jgi:hypothetical protein
MEVLLSSVQRRNASSEKWRRIISLVFLSVASQNLLLLLFGNSKHGGWTNDHFRNVSLFFDFSPPAKVTPKRSIIAYAVTITKFDPGEKKSIPLLGRAAVLHQSIKIAMNSSRYDYHMYAFVHPEADNLSSSLEQFGYHVLIRDTPFNISEVTNSDFIHAQEIGCCMEKEYIKLYSYTLLDYPVVIHLDLDVLVLKPMDDLFDLMISPTYDKKHFQNSTMWADLETAHGPVDFLFTRDYNMVRKTLIIYFTFPLFYDIFSDCPHLIEKFLINKCCRSFLHTKKFNKLEHRVDFWWSAPVLGIFKILLMSLFRITRLWPG